MVDFASQTEELTRDERALIAALLINMENQAKEGNQLVRMAIGSVDLNQLAKKLGIRVRRQRTQENGKGDSE